MLLNLLYIKIITSMKKKFEIKDENKPPSQRKLTNDQVKWHSLWQGNVHTINCLSDALNLMGVCND